MVLYIGIYIESDWLYHAEWVALSNGQSGSELAEYSEVYDTNRRALEGDAAAARTAFFPLSSSILIISSCLLL